MLFLSRNTNKGIYTNPCISSLWLFAHNCGGFFNISQILFFFNNFQGDWHIFDDCTDFYNPKDAMKIKKKLFREQNSIFLFYDYVISWL